MTENCAQGGAQCPAWQYAAARSALYECGKKVEILACYEPSFRFMAEWWKQLYGESEGKDGKGLFPASVEFTADLHSMGQYIQQGERLMFETVVRYDQPRTTLTVPFDESNGGEQSGHIIFSKYASTGDGILTSLKMMEVMLAKKKPMSELAAALKIYPQVLENVRVTDKKAAQSDEAVQTAVKKVAEGLGDTGRILVRESGTEPVVRVMVEAPDHDTCQKYVSEVVDVIRDRGYSL